MQRTCLLLACLLVLSLSACDSAEDDPGVRIVRYDGPPIERNNVSDSWQGRVEEVLTGTRVILTDSIFGDSLILFYEPDQELPVGGAAYYRNDYQTYAMYNGVIAIQDWYIDDVASGSFKGDFRGLQYPLAGANSHRGTFLVDLSEQP
ncbi:MAG: hypothetical protein GVY18_08635 [Bacteroidetes bacterium]|jgi:hypothetical protein|nr:hypothetical protein [Bacteroidota bacterium]